MCNIPIRKIDINLVQPGYFSIRTIESITKGADLIQDLHRHEYYLILAFSRGKGQHEIDFQAHTISDNTIFIMRPGQVHQLHIDKNSSGFIAQFGSDFYDSGNKVYKNALNFGKNTPFSVIDQQRFERLLAILKLCMEEFERKDDNYYDMIKLNLIQFFMEYARQAKDNERSQNTPDKLYDTEKLEEFMTLLEQNYKDKKQVSDYADLMNLSVFQLNSVLQKSLGKRCSEVIADFILLESKRQLLATSDQINQISYNLGYDDVSYFIRFFKKHLGVTPDAFRKNSK